MASDTEIKVENVLFILLLFLLVCLIVLVIEMLPTWILFFLYETLPAWIHVSLYAFYLHTTNAIASCMLLIPLFRLWNMDQDAEQLSESISVTLTKVNKENILVAEPLSESKPVTLAKVNKEIALDAELHFESKSVTLPKVNKEIALQNLFLTNLPIQWKIRPCFQCRRDTEFYCKTCKHDLCLQCKERHVIDLDTIYHDVVIYREKYEYILKQETCVRHPDRIYEVFCHSCELPVCSQCERCAKHKAVDIRRDYQTNRQQHREIIHNIRSETLYNSCFLLAGIKTDIKTCHTEISNRQSQMSTKARRIKKLIDTVICEVKIKQKSFIYRLQQQKRKLNRYIATTIKCEHRCEQTLNRPVKFLLFLKEGHAPNIKDNPALPQHILHCLTEENKMEGVIKSLNEIQITEKGKRQAKNECLLKLMSTPVLQRSVTVKGVRGICNISIVKPDRVWVSDANDLILANIEGDILHHLTDIRNIHGSHTVTSAGDLIYLDKDHNINKLSIENTAKSTRIKKVKTWCPQCVYCSLANDDLLVGVSKNNPDTAKVLRYSENGKLIQTIQQDITGQELYRDPLFIAENCNGDVIVSDSLCGVVVTNRGGIHRFSYTGPPSGPSLVPHGICTDALAHILVYDHKTKSVQMIDRDGHFLSKLLTEQQGIKRPWSLHYDDKTHHLWVGSPYIFGDESSVQTRVCIYRFIERQDYPTGLDQTETMEEV